MKLLEERTKRKQKQVVALLAHKGEEEFLKQLLDLMYLKLRRKNRYKELVEDFTAVYIFQGQKKGAYFVVEFKNNKIYLSKKRMKKWDFRVYFRDERYLYKFVLGEDGEYQQAVHEEEVEYTGNLNYMRRFTFIARTILQDKYN